MRDRISIILPCDLRYRDAVGAMILQVCQRLECEGAEAGLGYQVLSAFNEAFNNLSLHGQEDELAEASAVEVDLQLTSDSLTIEIRDEGAPFDYSEVAAPDLDQLPESGLGIFIMKSFMSEVHYAPRRAGAGKNLLRMVRELKGA